MKSLTTSVQSTSSLSSERTLCQWISDLVGASFQSDEHMPHQRQHGHRGEVIAQLPHKISASSSGFQIP